MRKGRREKIEKGAEREERKREKRLELRKQFEEE